MLFNITPLNMSNLERFNGTNYTNYLFTNKLLQTFVMLHHSATLTRYKGVLFTWKCFHHHNLCFIIMVQTYIIHVHILYIVFKYGQTKRMYRLPWLY